MAYMRFYMPVQVTNIDGKLVDDIEYQDDVENWMYNREQEMGKNIMSMMPHNKRSLRQSLDHKLIKKGGYITNATFKFYRSGIFQAYGVGKGLIHTKMGVIRGRKSKNSKKGHHANESNYYPTPSQLKPFKRIPKDWFDTVVESKISILAEVVQGYYGDKFLLAASAGTRIIKH